VAAHVNHARADAREQHAVLLVLSVELAHGDVHTGLADGVEGSRRELKFVDGIEIGMAAGDGDDLLGLALEDEGKKEVEEVDVGGNVGMEVLGELLL
jgi:hypothetical protein